MAHLFHITEEENWVGAKSQGVYRAPSLEQEGFIHLSQESQVLQTANRFYLGKDGLVLLEIDPAKLTAALQYEEVLDHGTFPHLYGDLNLNAVIGLRYLELADDGSFTGWH